MRIIDWPGVLIDEYTDIKTADKNNLETETLFALSRPPKDSELIRAEIVKDFVYRLPSLKATPSPFTLSVGAKQSTIKIYGLIPSGDEGASFWIRLTLNTDYNIVVDGVTKHLIINYQFGEENLLGTYDAQNEIDIYIEYKLETPITLQLTRIETAPRTSTFDFYYDASQGQNGSIGCFVPRIPQLFSKTTPELYDPDIPNDSNILVNIYYEVNSEIPDELLNQYATKDGLKIEQLLSSLFNNSGDEDNTDARWSAVFHSAIVEQVRSGFNFNNTNLFAAINESLKSFNAIAIPDTINKVFYIFDKDTAGVITDGGNPAVVLASYKQDTGLSIEYGKYLKDISQSISSENIVTIIRGLGADNITAASATPTGYNEYEDYTYYLDGAQISNYEDLITKNNIVPQLTKSSRWMSDRLATRLLLWMKAREGVENQLYQQMPSGNYTQPTIINEETGATEQETTFNPYNTFSLPQLAAQKRILGADFIVDNNSQIASLANFVSIGSTFAVRNDSTAGGSWVVYKVTGSNMSYVVEANQSIIDAQYAEWDGDEN